MTETGQNSERGHMVHKESGVATEIADHDPIHVDRLIAIVGPTAAGKTELAMKLARHLPVEIVGADSRQVYRHMDIGTAKPSPEERSQVPHHLVDIIDPDDVFNLYQYIYKVKQAFEIVKSRNSVPILVGGTGQYVMAILEGWEVPSVVPNSELRTRLEADLAAKGLESILEELRSLDPAASEAVDQKNPRRVIRAIERVMSGHRWGEQPTRVKPAFESIVVGVAGDRAELQFRADRRLDEMMANGFLEEVDRLLKAGYAPELPAMSGIGYSELADHLRNGTDLQNAVQRAKYRTHRYIRQQSNWFRESDSRISWFEMSRLDDAFDLVQTWYESANEGL